MLPSIAMVTPTLNQSCYLREAVDSVLVQGYRALDYIVMDGGSTDGSQEVLVSYGPRLRWVSKPDAGQSAAINQGWQQTQGEIIGWLNSDDRLAPGALARVGDFFANHPITSIPKGRSGETTQFALTTTLAWWSKPKIIFPNRPLSSAAGC